jgi:hypothetical protein
MAEGRVRTARGTLERFYASGNRTFENVDLQGADLRGIVLAGADLQGAYLHAANLQDANLEGVNFSRAMLRQADLSGANLRAAELRGAHLEVADLDGALLGLASLRNADLDGANLRGAELRGADFYATLLNGTAFDGALFGATTFARVNLSTAIELEFARHSGPSSVGIETLLLSGGRVPEVFLRGCGVPEHVIELQRALVGGGAPIEFYSCFISYSHKDDGFAQRLHGRLQQEGLRVWFAPEELKAGRKLHEQIDDAIRLHDKLLLVLSEASMASEWVATEISKARQREGKEGRQVLFPIALTSFEAIRNWERFDADTGKDSAREVREYFIPDFSNWKDHDAFEAAFARLLKDLRKSAE